jgi:hypothetical protein
MIAEKCTGETGIAFAITKHSESNLRTGDDIMAKAVHFNAWPSIG